MIRLSECIPVLGIIFRHAYIRFPTRYRTRLAGGPLLRVATIRRTADTHYRHTLQTHTTNTFLFISQTTNVPLFKFRCNIFIGVRIIKEMPVSVASGTPCIKIKAVLLFHSHHVKACRFGKGSSFILFS
jgi:hypothetical protein